MNTHPAMNTMSAKMFGAMGENLPNMGPLKHWSSVRTPPKPAKKSLHQLVKEKGIPHE
jgi:L-lactate dehydrogenase complex protein LldF